MDAMAALGSPQYIDVHREGVYLCGRNLKGVGKGQSYRLSIWSMIPGASIFRVKSVDRYWR